MKNAFIVLALVSTTVIGLLPSQIIAQVPQKMSYQAIIRDVSGNLITNASVGMRISILQGAASGAAVYSETQTPTTNSVGLISIEIGNGNVESGEFASIEWANGSHFIKIETDPTGSTNYTITSNSQLLSVPYALYAETAKNLSEAITETDPVFETSVAGGITSADTTNWNNKLETELDGDFTNELQILSFNNDTIFLTDGGFVKLPVETDPFFTAAVAAGITTEDTVNWNRKTEFSGDYDDLINKPATANIDSTYIVRLMKTDQDYIDFGTFENFTNNSNWSIIERIKIPTDSTPEGGWHFFRGKAWEDKEGDIAMQITTSQIYAWCFKNGWQSIVYDHSFQVDQWYDICLQYNAGNQALELYVDGSLVGQKSGVEQQDDSGNTNKLFWGGQDVDPIKNVGDLYSESSIVIAHQAWLQRLLTTTEIQNYQGYIAPDPALFFLSQINSNLVTDLSDNNLDGTNGNTPEYLNEVHYNGSEFNEPISVNDNLQVSGDLTVDGNITGNVVVETIHVSKISGLLGQGYTLNFPVILDNQVTLEIEGISTTEKVVMISSLGHETERIEGFAFGHIAYDPGPSMEYPLIFETTSQQDADNISVWFDNEPWMSRSCRVIIKDLSGTETANWILLYYMITSRDEGVDGRTRFTLVPSSLPDNVLECMYDGVNGSEWAFNPETDTLVEIEGVSHQYFCPIVNIDEEDHTITLTYDYNEGGTIYNWAKDFSTGTDVAKRVISVINATDGDPTKEIGRYNHFECFPIKFEHFYGFGLNTKLKSRIVISYEYREEG